MSQEKIEIKNSLGDLKSDHKTEVKPSSNYWLSLEQWQNDEEFVKRAQEEFVSSPLKTDDEQSGWARREFLMLMGASVALGTVGCARRPAEKIVPYVKRPPEIIPGLANYYASSFYDAGDVVGTVVKTREGRPIKLDGNKFFPGTGEALSARGQSKILSLYDPDRLTGPVEHLLNAKKTNKDVLTTSWTQADKKVKKALNKGGVAVLMGSSPQMTTAGLVNKFTEKFDAKVYRWSPFSKDLEKKAYASVTGSSNIPTPHFDKAKLIFSLGSDFLGSDPGSLSATRSFSKNRDISGSMSKLIQVESTYTLTGSNADERTSVKASELYRIAVRLVKIISRKLDVSIDFDVNYKEMLGSKYGLSEEILGYTEKWAQQLLENKGQSLVVTGALESQTQDALKLQEAVIVLNKLLGNFGKTLVWSAKRRDLDGSTQQLKSLIAAMKSGEIKTLFIHSEINPVYSSAKSLGFLDALANVEMVVSFASDLNETASASNLVLPDDHPMEKWSDLSSHKGLWTIQQPTIEAMYNTRSFEDSLLLWMGQKTSWDDYFKQIWKSRASSSDVLNFGAFWTKFLQTGVWDVRSGESSPSLVSGFSLSEPEQPVKEEELSVYRTMGLQDGSMANVSWLQEFPDPVTKICWDNYLCVSPAYAKEHKLKEGHIVKLYTGRDAGLLKAYLHKKHDSHGSSHGSGHSAPKVEKPKLNFIKVPVHIQPGQEAHTFSLALGYGRSSAGKLGTGVGVNAYELIQALDNGQLQYAGLDVAIVKTNEKETLANVQGHHSMEGRQIVVEATLSDILKDPEAGYHGHKVFSIWKDFGYEGRKWGMSVDLNKCTGCSACMVACQSENNIPVVGKKNVINGREMHWIRVDRYYTGDPANPDTVFQPLMCMHCDLAPCETVCPVLATVHGDEGTNDMIYNRCVGTRYCSNNCPYKVRRFNWFNYNHKKEESPLDLAMNPEVTVRSRGVMEKCTFCIHKIKEEDLLAKNDNREYKDGDIKTACQTTCPTEAIIFGNLNDSESKVARLHREKRSYDLLEELNTRPSVKYMTKVRNTVRVKSHGGKAHKSNHSPKEKHIEKAAHGAGHGDGHGDGHSSDSHAPKHDGAHNKPATETHKEHH